jgi:hypothetical protein
MPAFIWLNPMALLDALSYSSNLKMEAIYSCETSLGFQQTTRRHVAEHRTLQKTERSYGTDM